ncbi:transforming acidic coiled-coil-containing protein 3 isoform X2 [Sceloporus undulatus]|uniref:transforming acidic coiled-coil-containing protein 3 isoform X2 n=1 Tax=Sceloporus undulatus TaxID=8520 RepID=UPI001C4DB82E|nr:transforming acidic coiled-coil-containing protein 3 isoform X2 [Sceloporus undulatus]
MSLQTLKEENISDATALESCAMLFTSPEITGRPSILRPSQKENVPPKGIVKPMKVTFQTPVRDPQTRKILSPDIRKKITPLVDDCLEIPEDLVFPAASVVTQPIVKADTDSAKEETETEEKVSFDLSNDVMPEKNKRSHIADMSAINDADPFKSTGGLLNSPKSQTISPLQVCQRKETRDRNSLLLDAIYLQTATENNLSQETSCEPACSFHLVSSLDVDSSKQNLCSNQAIKQVSNSICKTDPSSVNQVQNHPSQLVPESCSFGYPCNWEIEEKDKGRTSIGIEETPAPKGSCNFDYDKLDPDFNPFGGGSKLQNSPNCPVPSIEKNDIQEDSVLLKIHFPKTDQYNCSDESKAIETTPDKQKEFDEQIVTEEQVVPEVGTQTEPSSELVDENTASAEALCQGNSSLHEAVDDTAFKPPCQTEKVINKSSHMEIENEEFRSPMDVLGMDIEIDYLEQFGTSSFKESVLRKQSLYLKFDPLLSESPKRSDSAVNEVKPTVPALFQNTPSIVMASDEVKILEQEEKPLGLDLLGTFPHSGKTLEDIPIRKNTSLFPYALSTDSIIEVLKYSQKDMDAAVEKVKHEMDTVVKKLTSEVKEKQIEALEWKMKHDKIYIESKEMGKIVAEFEGTITQVMEESQIQKELAKQELQKVLDEKQQAISDLSSMEKSFSELFKRFEKQKEAIEGFQRNEEALKKCVEDYLARIKKEEQRYQALKAHAEEKLCQANEEIAQVRSKAQTEVVALQATLRKEQMRIQSLERSIEQKTKENDELTKICDDLISKMEKM